MPATQAVQMLGDYVVGEHLGDGGFSFVKLGIHKDTKERVALKMLRKDKLSVSDASVKKQVEREITAMAKIQHKNVIRLKTVDWDAKYERANGTKIDVILVVLELATGGELFEFLAFTGCFEEAIARTYFHQLINGLAYCHSQGVAHRDLKPENLLLDGQFQLKLADFGFSNVFAAGTGQLPPGDPAADGAAAAAAAAAAVAAASKIMYTECGTPGYMAPEMINNKKGYDPCLSDIWACGVILFIMLAGFPPFQKPAMSDWWFAKLATGKHALFWQAHSRSAYFSDSTKDFINKILNPDPTKRLTIADIRKHPWFTGASISDAALTAELTRRKQDVDEAKNRQRLEKKTQEAQSAGSTDGSLESETVRALGDALPASHPAMGYGVAAFPRPGAGAALFQSQSPFGSSSPFDFGAVESQDATSPSADGKDAAAGSGSGAGTSVPPAFSADEHVTCYTRFDSTAKPAYLLARVSAVLEAMNARISTQPAQWSLRATVMTGSGNVSISAQIFADPTDAATSVVLFRRRQGDSMQYRSIYQDLRTQLLDLVAQKKTGAAAASASVAGAKPDVAAAASAVIATAKATIAAAAPAPAPAPAAKPVASA